MLIKQLYKSYKKISISNQILRVVSDFIINFFLLKYLGFLRNILLQKLISCTSISVNSIKIFLKDGNERLYLFNKVSFVIEKDLINWINTFKNKDTF